MNLLAPHLASVRVPRGGNRVYKDECAFSFDTPESDDGLFVCLSTFLGFCREFVELHFQKTGYALFLNIKRRKKEIEKREVEDKKTDDAPPNKKPTKMALGVEGGFDLDEEPPVEYEENYCLVVLPSFTTIPLPCPELPLKIQESIAGVIAAEAASRQEAVAAWEGEVKFISKHAENLKQLDNGVKIPPSGWKCEKCNLVNNLWLNLTDGSILCGRRYYDGSGGNNHAVEQYECTRYPLAVKLGTITADGADVYSYDEDAMVEDPLLAQHLAHFGINRMLLTKTDKTMEELEVDANLKFQFDAIQESGLNLQPMFGGGYTGLRNLGNTCYLNSVVQMLFTLPDFQRRFFEPARLIFESAPRDPTQDFHTQMAKLGVGLLSGKYSHQATDADKSSEGEKKDDKKSRSQAGIPPSMFKALVGRGHPEFSTNRQQDAQEFLLHLLNMVDRSERGTPGSVNPIDCLKFKVEERVQCLGSGCVRYSQRTDTLWALPVPLEEAVNIEAVAAWEKKKKEMEEKKEKIKADDVVRPVIRMASCIAAFASPEAIDDFYSTALQTNLTAHKTTRFVTFPDYLVVQMKKFSLSDDWTPKKLDVVIDVPFELDISSLRATGLQPGEKELPEQTPQQLQPQQPQIDESLVQQLADMGFAHEGCRKAVYHTHNSGVEAAMAWILEHMEDADFSDPLLLGPQSSSTASGEATFSDDSIMMLTSMGFTQEQAQLGLKSTGGSLERAADWLFSHADELDKLLSDSQSDDSKPSEQQLRDGCGKYRLRAFISHMGSSPMTGHYVVHILKEERWVIFNDRKVALSERLPKDLAYLYLFERIGV
ncbi:ubiquitin carboxyl-terminal hydrolase 5-like [Corticium candelabrum]|uniref:ubiquitin carboxyl-terminal hydrolase 5-like n=1 Tax=Corticium candelabrum TaxID=121492 RepID=UPI002E258ADD|nr:ubiquitin carboxyl-terminal hydrolase 5-like [Corticium candelabrum]